MGSVSVLSCICCMFVPCVPVLNAAFCMTCSLLMLVEDARWDHMEEAYSRAGLITALYVATSVSFILLYIILTVLLTLNFKKLFLVSIIPLIVLIHFPLDY